MEIRDLTREDEERLVRRLYDGAVELRPEVGFIPLIAVLVAGVDAADGEFVMGSLPAFVQGSAANAAAVIRHALRTVDPSPRVVVVVSECWGIRSRNVVEASAVSAHLAAGIPLRELDGAYESVRFTIERFDGTSTTWEAPVTEEVIGELSRIKDGRIGGALANLFGTAPMRRHAPSRVADA